MLLSRENIVLINLMRLQQAFGAGSLKSFKIYDILKANNRLSVSLDKHDLYTLIKNKDADKILSIKPEQIFKIIDDCIKNNICV